ncbi:MAG: ABC transporter ATP-binding protein/permease [Clostridia bacterium]|nr:ABC transporter ATP-binding protein/permease [Clostridia bacterium]
MEENKTPDVMTEEKDKEQKSKEEKKKLTPEEKKAEKEKKKAEREKKKKENKNKPKDIKKSTKRLLSYLKPYRGRIIFVCFLVILSSAMSAGSSVLMKPIFNTLEYAIMQGEKHIPKEQAVADIIKYLVIFAAVAILGGVLTLAYSKMMLKITQKALNGIRRELFDHIQTLPLNFFDTHKTGDIMSRFNADVEAINSLVSNGFISLISAVITFAVTISLMIYYSWRITLTLFGTVALMLFVILSISSVSSKLYKKQHKINGDYTGYIEEHIRGLKCIKVFNHEAQVKEGFFKITEDYRKTGTKAGIVSGLMSPLLSLISRANYAVSIIMGAYLVIKGKMDVGSLIVYKDYSKSFGNPIATIAGQYNSLMSALAGAERIFEILDMPGEVDEGEVRLVKEEGEGWSWEKPDGVRIPVKGVMRFNNVSFSYKEGEPVLKNISLEAQSGKKLAFVGSTGAGKTTITNLINRFYDIEDGEITYDGIDVKDIKKDDLRHSLAVVLQDVKLFSGTVEENIRYGRLDASHEDVVAAAKLANAHDFIEKLPEGYETQLGTNGQNISEGQRQLISIARAAIADTPVLILDEATSSVDTRTERLIELGMDKLMEGRTVFVIAHRLSTVRNSDDIIVLEHGEIIEEGNHAGLIEQQGKYYQLYTGAFELK